MLRVCLGRGCGSEVLPVSPTAISPGLEVLLFSPCVGVLPSPHKVEVFPVFPRVDGAPQLLEVLSISPHAKDALPSHVLGVLPIFPCDSDVLSLTQVLLTSHMLAVLPISPCLRGAPHLFTC